MAIEEVKASKAPAIEVAAQTYQRLNSTHPFGHANGRVCQLVMDLVLQAAICLRPHFPKAKYPLSAEKTAIVPDTGSKVSCIFGKTARCLRVPESRARYPLARWLGARNHPRLLEIRTVSWPSSGGGECLARNIKSAVAACL